MTRHSEAQFRHHLQTKPEIHLLLCLPTPNLYTGSNSLLPSLKIWFSHLIVCLQARIGNLVQNLFQLPEAFTSFLVSCRWQSPYFAWVLLLASPVKRNRSSRSRKTLPFQPGTVDRCGRSRRTHSSVGDHKLGMRKFLASSAVQATLEAWPGKTPQRAAATSLRRLVLGERHQGLIVKSSFGCS